MTHTKEIPRPHMASEPQKEAIRLIDLIDKEFQSSRIGVVERIAAVMAKEMEKRALFWAHKSDHDTIKDYFNQVRKAITEHDPY